MKPLNYIKVPASVMRVWGTTDEAMRLPDGNYAIFWATPRAFGYAWTDYPQMLKDTGGVVLTPTQVRLEQDGLLCTPVNTPALAKYLDKSEDVTEPENSETETEPATEPEPDNQTETEENTQNPEENTQTEPEPTEEPETVAEPEPDTEPDPTAEEGGGV